MKKEYISPELEIISYRLTDVILYSVNDESEIKDDVVNQGQGGNAGDFDNWN